MEFRVVDAKRLNVYLTKEELEQENINLNMLYDSERALKCQLAKIFKRAGEEMGFGMENTPLEVEIIPIIDGDLFISICKTESDTDERYIENSFYHYVFSDVEDFIALCKQIQPIFHGVSDLYYYNEIYHAFLYPKHMTQSAILHLQATLLEYGTEASYLPETNVSLGVIFEHGRLICKNNCVDLFTKVFKNRV